MTNINPAIAEGAFLDVISWMFKPLIKIFALHPGGLDAAFLVNFTQAHAWFQVSRSKTEYFFILGIESDESEIHIVCNKPMGHCLNGRFKEGRFFCGDLLNVSIAGNIRQGIYVAPIGHHASLQ
jgi:hypothetical protein